ncbi:transferrin receptor 1b [Chanos chanos]|uniref:Transferrin receptor 1b n=1 Tax=Chanos chanos TaxID=29144 RepID=A0A6J2UXS9_CHACN|nr:transferrin receptor protein 1-like [Chanos chanos]
MAAVINEARSKISKIFTGEPRSYTRFNLAQSTDGDGSHVEVKLPSEVEDEVTITDGESRPPLNTYTQRRALDRKKNIFYLAVGALLLFVIGYLIGYMTHQKPNVEPSACTETEGVSERVGEDMSETLAAVQPMELPPDWSGIKTLFQEKFSAEAFEKQFSEFSQSSHNAGSDGDEFLAKKVFDNFTALNMAPWFDEHFVTLQVPSSANPNKVMFGTDEIGSPKGYLAYSATGTKKGRVVYANYGRPEDFEYLRNMKKNLTDSVLLLRAGELSMAQKVANAAKQGVAAVLIYPDSADYKFDGNTEISGHVHLGSGDPYTPGFPSFNHTQFPPAKSSGLPQILAQTITGDMAVKILQKMTGEEAPTNFIGALKGVSKYRLGGEDNEVTVTVNNVLKNTRIQNVFGVIKGFVDADRYVVIGAQRDSITPGYAKSTVGTTLLVELARAISEMVENDNFRPRRSLVFASWSAGDYGNVGATEWLEGYLSSLDKKAFTYISLDGAITGVGAFKASASPLLHTLLQNTMKEVKQPMRDGTDQSLFAYVAGAKWETSVLEPMKMDDTAYPFMAISGIPSVSFRFVSTTATTDYVYYGTKLDDKTHLDYATNHRLSTLAVSAAQIAGQMALRLVHDHLLYLDVTKYLAVIGGHVRETARLVSDLKRSGVVTSSDSGFLTSDWLIEAYGSYSRASRSLDNTVKNSDLNDMEMCRIINDRIMRVEHNFLSPYVSPRETSFRHIFFGQGDHTFTALKDHLNDLKKQAEGADMGVFRNQFALATWTIQGCANDLAGDVWDLNNEI